MKKPLTSEPPAQIDEPDDMPPDVKAVKSKTRKIDKNNKGFWEADFGDGIIMVYIPPGEFTMGSNDGDSDEKPPHKVYLDVYWMGKTEVTVKQYMTFVNDTKSYYPEWLEKGSSYNIETGKFDSYKKLGEAVKGDNYPIVGISWYDAKAYCDWLLRKTGVNFKLPTEAQWEKAASGPDSYKYPWGNREPDKSFANFNNNIGKTSPVGSYPQGASPYGLLDMAGNVWEWCNDWYGESYYKSSPDKNPPGPKSGTYRVYRSGGWVTYAGFIRCADRNCCRPSVGGSDLGFRLCQDNK